MLFVALFQEAIILQEIALIKTAMIVHAVCYLYALDATKPALLEAGKDLVSVGK